MNNTSSQHLVFEANMTRYEIILSEFKDRHYGTDKCMLVWLDKGNGGRSFVWEKGDRIYRSYAAEKSGINGADLAGLLSEIKKYDSSLIGELVGFDSRYLS